MLEQLQTRGWLVGGESSGHLLCLDRHTTGDGIISSLQVLMALSVLGVGAAIWGKRKLLFAGLITLTLFGLWALYDMYQWGYAYGHDLDPRAAIKVEGMVYQPPLLGHKQLLNFDAWSTPDIGGWVLFAVMGLLAGVYFLELRKARRTAAL